jgi:hypothetical protein
MRRWQRTRQRDEPPKMATAPKLVPSRSVGIDSRVKSWIDNVLAPLLVREFLGQTKHKGGKILKFGGHVVQCHRSKASPDEVSK